jgi:hyperosmotically inducible periplasmic protein
MRSQTRLAKWIACAGVFLPLLLASPQATPPDNTKTNAGDRETGAPTADQSRNNRADRENTKLIRRAITSDKTLSTYGHNVKIISDHGRVTLRGPVRSDEERKTIEAHATEVAGPGNVDNQLTVKSEGTEGAR